jgi:hypothetical protein
MRVDELMRGQVGKIKQINVQCTVNSVGRCLQDRLNPGPGARVASVPKCGFYAFIGDMRALTSYIAAYRKILHKGATSHHTVAARTSAYLILGLDFMPILFDYPLWW